MTERQHEMSDDCWCQPCKIRYSLKGEPVKVEHRENCDCE